MRKQHSKFRDLLLYGKKGALYSTLIRLSNSYGQEIDEGILITVPLTNQELANYSATARESLNRMLGELRRENIIEMRDGLILIKDIDFLKKEIRLLDALLALRVECVAHTVTEEVHRKKKHCHKERRHNKNPRI